MIQNTLGIASGDFRLYELTLDASKGLLSGENAIVRFNDVEISEGSPSLDSQKSENLLKVIK